LHAALHAAEHREGSVGEAANRHHRLHLATVVAGAEGVVVRVAGTEASARVAVPHTHVVVTAGCRSSEHTAAGHADTSVAVPHALVVTVAAELLYPAELADLRAAGLGGTPCAHGLGRAVVGRLQQRASLTALWDARVPHAAVHGIARRLVRVQDRASALAVRTIPVTERVGLAESGDVRDSESGDLSVTCAVVAASRRLRRPSTLSIGCASSGGVVAVEATDVAHVDLPLAHGVVEASALGLDVVTLAGASQLQAVPHAVIITHAAALVASVAVHALAAASRDSPLALSARRRAGSRGLLVASLLAGSRRDQRIPEASSIGIAILSSCVTVEALVIASRDEGGTPLAVGVHNAEVLRPVMDTLHAAELLIEVKDAHAVGVTRCGEGNLVTILTASGRREVPHAARQRTAACGVIVQEGAVHAADAAQPAAHAFLCATELVQRGAGSLAALRGVVVHTKWVAVTRVLVLRERELGRALVHASGRGGVPVAHAVAAICLHSVDGTIVAASSGDDVPIAACVGLAGLGVGVEVQALACARLGAHVPLAERGATALGLVQQVAVTVTLGEQLIPHAVKLWCAGSLGHLAVLASLLADSSRLLCVPQAHEHVGARGHQLVRGGKREFGGLVHQAVTTALTRGAEAVPHADRIAVASGLSGVLVRASLAALRERRVVLALVVRAAVRLVTQVAELTALAVCGVPLASSTTNAGGLRVHLLAGLAAERAGACLIPVASGVARAVGSGGPAELADLEALGTVDVPLAHTTTVRCAESRRVVRRARASLAASGALRVPHANGVGIATTLVEVCIHAVGDANIVDPAARRVRLTVGLTLRECLGDVVVTAAAGAADGVRGIPTADSVCRAVRLIEVTIRALVLASTADPLAHGDSRARGHRVDRCADTHANATLTVPLAAEVQVAGILALVVHGAGTLARRQWGEAPRSLGLLVAAAGAVTLVDGDGSTNAAGLTALDVDGADLGGVGVIDALGETAADRGAGLTLAAQHTARARRGPHAILIGASGSGCVALGADGLALQVERAPVTERVRRALGRVEDLGADLAAGAEVVTPLAHAVGNAVRVGSVLGAVGLADTSGGIPHAERVEVAARLQRVAHGADGGAALHWRGTPLQSSRGLDPSAQRWVHAALGLTCDDRTILAADARRRIPQAVAVGVDVAGTLGFIQQVATLQAALQRQAPPASSDLRAVVVVAVLVATVAAALGFDVPLALFANVAAASGARVVAVRAAIVALSIGAVDDPLAHGSGAAVGCEQHRRAETLAVGQVNVPLARRIGIASSRCRELVVAANEAVGGVLVAHVGEGLARAGELVEGLRRNGVHHASAGLLANGSSAVPHAVNVGVAACLLCVAETARAGALHLRGLIDAICGGVHGVHILAAVVRNADRLVLVQVARRTAEVVPRAPQAAGLCVTVRLGRQVLAGTAALAGDCVPPAVRVRVAVGLEAVRLGARLLALRASPDAGSGCSPAFLLAHQLARTCADGRCVDPHAVLIGIAPSEGVVLGTAGRLAACGRRVPDTKVRRGASALAHTLSTAVLLTLVADAVPLALRVGIAGALGGVLVVAHDAAAARGEEAPRAGTARLHRAACSIPAAALIRTALRLSGTNRCATRAVAAHCRAVTSEAVVPHAHEVHAAVGHRRGEVATLLADVRRVVPNALIISCAGRLDEVTPRALLETRAGADLAEGALEAVHAAVELLAGSGALRGHRVPHAAALQVAVKLRCLEVQALHLAASSTILELALRVALAVGRAIVVQLALELAGRGGVVPLAVASGLCHAVGIAATQCAESVAVLRLIHGVTSLRTSPLAQRVLVAFRQTVHLAATLCTNVVIVHAVVIQQASSLGEGRALAAARSLEEGVVLAHAVTLALLLVLEAASLAAEVRVDVPHALIVGIAETLRRVAVAALQVA